MNLKSAFCLSAAMCAVFAFSQDPFPRGRITTVDVPLANQRATDTGHTDPNRVLNVTISLPYADPAGIKALADSVSDPNSPNFREFITPQEVASRFALSLDKVQAVVNYLKAQGFTVENVGANHLTIQTQCTVRQAEAAFSTQIDNFHMANVKVRPDFYSFTAPLQAPAAIAPFILDVAGIESISRPVPMILTPDQARVLYGYAPIYGTFKGQGRHVAISSWDGFGLSNVPLYYAKFGIPAPAGGVGSNIHVVTIDGGSQNTTASGEGDIDIQMVLGMVPLSQFYIYDGSTSSGTAAVLMDVLSREQTDNTAEIISESYGWILSNSEQLAAHNIHLAMTTQGITYIAASGDTGTATYATPFGFIDYPTVDGDVLMVGGTVATTDSTGNRVSEVAWNGSGGGWSPGTSTLNVRPPWQKGNGVPTTINKRLAPDVAIMGGFQLNGTGAFWFYTGGALRSDTAGTSFASPVFAGQLAGALQRAVANGGKGRLGRINDLIYQQNGKANTWFDVVTGSNGNLPNGSPSNAHPGWDTTTGWGAINWQNMSLAKSITLPLAPAFLGITEGSNLGFPTSNVNAQDSQYFEIAPVSVPNLGQAASASFAFTLPTTVVRSSVNELDFSVTAKMASGSTGQLYLFNWVTGKWDIAKSFVMGASNTAAAVVLTNSFTSYMSAAGQYRVLVRGLQPLSAGITTNPFAIDYVASSTKYLPPS